MAQINSVSSRPIKPILYLEFMNRIGPELKLDLREKMRVTSLGKSAEVFW